jgi:poly(ADP-ribose) glycohydrolase ARH3
MLGTAVGDALGAPFEGQPHVNAEAVANVERGSNALRWTDDTAMTIAVAESLVARAGFDGADLAHRFADHHAREPWRGYGAGPPRVFAAIRAGARWDAPARELFAGSGSFGNGGAMRAAPAGLFRYRSLDAAARLARCCASVTHSHELGLQGAALQAAAVAWLTSSPGAAGWSGGAGLVDDIRRTAPATEFQVQLDRVIAVAPDASSSAAARALGNGISAVEAVPAALWAFLRHPGSFADTVRAAIALGGDTDTIAAMAGALSGAFLGATAIPEPWRARIEARERMQRLADALCSLAARPLSAIAPD